MPPSLLRKLDLKVNSYLAIEEKKYGFILCKLEVYDNFLKEFTIDMEALDHDVKSASKSIKDLFNRFLNKKINKLHTINN